MRLKRMDRLAKLGLVFAALVIPAQCFIYKLEDTFPDRDRCSYSEGWMFSSNNGPKGAPQGPSYVSTDLEIAATSAHEPSSNFNIRLMFYRSMVLDFGSEDNINICAKTPAVPSAFEEIEILSFPAVQAEEGEREDSEHLYVANVVSHRVVTDAGLIHAFIQVCPSDVVITGLSVKGELTFRNPYGYLPGMDFGVLPFEIFRFLASVALCVFFALSMWRHRSNVLPVHSMIFGVVLLGTFEALSWLIAYSYMNRTGKSYCCPYPGTVITAMLLEVLRRTTSRFMLLVICLGYGITRVQLKKRELVCVVSLTIAFFGSGVLQLASSIASASHVHSADGYGNYDPSLAIPAILTDMVFLFWIYGTLADMIKELKEVNETYKLKMYKGLAWTLATFVSLFTTLTVAMLAAEGSQKQSWEWKWEWIQVVSWEILNFSMLTAVSIIWRPSPRSAMLAYSKQLATGEFDAEETGGAEIEGVEMQGPAAGHFTIGIGEGSDSGQSSPGNGRQKEQYFEEEKADMATVQHGSRAVYQVADFEPQRNTNLT